MHKNEPKIELIISHLIHDGYVVVEDFLQSDVIENLNKLAKIHYAQKTMQAAKVGLKNKLRNNSIRGDHIVWLEENSQNEDVKIYFEQMQLLKQAFNEHLFLNMQEIESHFAIYPVGAFYQKHLDQFGHVSAIQTLNNQTSNIQARQISSVLYLNKNWRTALGGQLRLYLNNDDFIDILPNAGRLVLFLSAQFWHEVLPAKVERLSITGWFRTRNQI